ncbi:MAG TPA: sigma-70 family RNA polymerase sigma factor [Chthoniobacteraceae bacterium]|jgi:RNA polymerase sigma-70 factor (ECF subfamily)|nr:sigma-70 family RNA polymerase sigma factor [Chthoniobacteraceae bacterium]
MEQPEPSVDIPAEIELLRRIGQGDRECFSQLYDLISSAVFSAAYRVLNNQQAAEDVLQEVFLQIWEKAALYDPARGKPLTWAITLTRNKAIDRLRSTQRRGRLRDTLEKESGALEQFDDRSSFDAVDTKERGKLVSAALDKLTDEQREALELAFFHGLTQSEIADQLGEPLGTIKARIRRGMIRLKGLLDSDLR